MRANVWIPTLVLYCIAAAACRSDDADTDSAGADVSDAPPQPVITRILAAGKPIWQKGQTQKPAIRPGDELVLEGLNFGEGPGTTLSKVLVGNSRALERDLPLFEGSVHLLNELAGGDLYEETTHAIDTWKKDILAWSDTQIRFTVPTTVSAGDTALVVQVQRFKDTMKNTSGQAFKVRDPLLDFQDPSDREKAPQTTVGVPGPASASLPVAVAVDNPGFEAARQRGEAMFWAWDFNLGVAQQLGKTGWDDIFGGSAVDPLTRKGVSPSDFGAILIDDAVQVPDVARQPHAFDPYPIANPLETLISSSLKSGTTTPIKWVGYVRAEGKNPLIPGLLAKGDWIGFNCASCHTRRIDYEATPGKKVAKAFVGIPNPRWNAKWATYSGTLRGLKGSESAFKGPEESVDKTQLLHALPDGTAESSLTAGEGSGTFANDHFYSPVAIPSITRHLPLRRALSRNELIAGFEGSYLHPQAPEGTMGPVLVPQLKDLTAYMSTLDRDHDTLVTLGMYRWLTHKSHLAEVQNAGEGAFVQMGLTKALASFPDLAAKVEAGRQVFQRDCASCHASNFGTNSDETIFAFTDVGTYFSPSLWNREGGGLRTAVIRELYWVQGRGLLHDGHVRSTDPDRADSAEMLVNPDRCSESSALYNQLYTIGPQSFRIPKGTPEQERAIRQQAYFTDWPKGGTGDETQYLYWDYQQMRKSFGPREFGTATKQLPVAPHPWCAKSTADVDALLHYLFTL